MSISREKHRDALSRDESLRRAVENKRAYYQRNREAILAKRRAMYYDPHNGYAARLNAIKRSSHLRMRYGISHKDYEAMMEAQGHQCAVCGAKDSGTAKSKFFDVDHCHETGKVRGLLCRKCNVTAGVLEKNRDLIAKIEAYIASHKEPK